jgi:hypothetical protein
MVGHWMKKNGRSGVIILHSGDVWSDYGKMQGKVISSSAYAGAFTFGDTHYFCSYNMDFRVDYSAVSKLVSQSPRTACPSGEFDRPFASGRIE